jgi:hypothetical protein
MEDDGPVESKVPAQIEIVSIIFFLSSLAMLVCSGM